MLEAYPKNLGHIFIGFLVCIHLVLDVEIDQKQIILSTTNNRSD